MTPVLRTRSSTKDMVVDRLAVNFLIQFCSGKTFRKMISECLQKDPAKRPTASELLKHAFFKNKAKDKKYLQSVLVNAAPNPEVRMTRSKPKKPGTSGRLHRNETGDWVWSDDEEGDSDDETIQKKPPKNKQVEFCGY